MYSSQHDDESEWRYIPSRTVTPKDLYYNITRMLPPSPPPPPLPGPHDSGRLEEPLRYLAQQGTSSMEPWSHIHRRLLDPRSGQYEDSEPYQHAPTGDSTVYFSAKSGKQTTFFSAPSEADLMHKERMRRLKKETEYEFFLKVGGVGPVDPKFEQDWSGRGQHAQFEQHENKTITEILPIQDFLGRGNSAVVHSVLCRRILLARKTIYTNRRFTKRQAIQEIAHLTRLKHSHIVRLIGTYIWQTELSILMYPVAEHNLASFLEFLEAGADRETTDWRFTAMVSSCRHFYHCLSSAISHIHYNLTKHMDIKPQNILVRSYWEYKSGRSRTYMSKVYISDFGIARSYQTPEAVDTDGTTAFSRRYAAPEVVLQDTRGLPADIFSMGCVFVEIFTTLHGITKRTRSNEDTSWENRNVEPDRNLHMREYMEDLFSKGTEKSFQNNVEAITDFLQSPAWNLDGAMVQFLLNMIARNPERRPTALDLTKYFPPLECCTTGPDELQRQKYDANGETTLGDIEESIMEDQERGDQSIILDLIAKSH